MTLKIRADDLPPPPPSLFSCWFVRSVHEVIPEEDQALRELLKQMDSSTFPVFVKDVNGRYL